MSLENTWQEIRDHSFIQNLSRSFRFTAPWRCCFSSVHLTHFLQSSGQRTGMTTRSLVLCSVTHFCVVFEVCFWIIVWLDDPNMTHYKISSLSLRRHAHGPLVNVWCIWHTYLETLQECRSRRRIGWIIQDFQETCVSRSLTFRLETKMPWCQTSSRKKKDVVFTTVTTNAYQDQLHAGFSKVCEIFKVRGIESLKYVREFHTPVWYCGDISTHRNVTLNEMNCDWLFDMSVKRPHGRALVNKCCHQFQTFSRQSEGLATRDYEISNRVRHFLIFLSVGIW